MTSTDNPWSLYWQAGHGDSCVATASPADQAYVADIWRVWAKLLSESARVLDLATGNGAVPRALITDQPNLRITGVDLADIAPAALLQKHPELAPVALQGGVDVCQLPFPDASFEGVTSQFGIEYADLSTALPEALRVLAPGGQLRCLMHHADSAVVSPAKPIVEEIDALQSDRGPLSVLNDVLAGRAGSDELEAAGRTYLDSSAVKTRHISGQIFQGIGQIMQRLPQQPGEAGSLASTMQSRLDAEKQRLQQLQSAALDERSASAAADALTRAGARDVSVKVIKLPGDDNALLGWQLDALR